MNPLITNTNKLETAAQEMERIVTEFALELAWPPDVVPEIEQIVRDAGRTESGLVDLRSIPFTTIDGEGSRDLDQALFIDRFQGGYRVLYAIADASYYIRPGMALFREAKTRGASYYLPGLSVPMLPRELSEGIISLNPQVERRAVVFTLVVNALGHCIKTSITPAVIFSHAALTFEQVQIFYDTPQISDLSNKPFTESLVLLRELGRLRLAEARQRDVVIYQRSNVRVAVGETGYGFNLVKDQRFEVEVYNEHISLLCNVEGAQYIAALGAQAAWRVHPNPPEARLAQLERLIAGIVSEHRLDPSRWRWHRRKTPGDSRGEPLADYLEKISNEQIDSRIRRVIERAAMVSNVRSGFSSAPGGHSGIGAPLYARLTAPMREMVGIHTHAVALASVGYRYWPESVAQELLEEMIDVANRAKETQRRLTKAANKLVIDRLFADDLNTPLSHRPIRQGTIMELRPNRVYLQLDSPPIELKIYHDDLGPNPQLFKGGAVMRLVEGKRIRVGAALDVRVRGHNEIRDRWYFDLFYRSGI